MYKLLMVLMFTWVSMVHSAEYQQGKDYWEIKQVEGVPIAEDENLFFTWLGCDSCRQIEAELSQQLEGFEVVPLIARQDWRPAAKVFYVMRMLEGEPNAELKLKQLVDAGTLDPRDQQALFEAVIELGYDKEAVSELLEDSALYERIEQAEALAEHYGIQYAPTVVVKGRYATDARHTMTIKKFGQVLDHLRSL
ncbi:DsbA family protein [Kangiella shandongensis]|uniref:DsbA family protein n=1 Tax=Kangiella shandongensis TaxID=2763258 RepID=UPI001CC11049|nr:DsbA family protein [Kangiella shandongensis]